MKGTKIFAIMAVLLLVGGLLLACGSSDSSSSPSVAYTGKTTLATVTNTIDDSVVESAWGTGQAGGDTMDATGMKAGSTALLLIDPVSYARDLMDATLAKAGERTILYSESNTETIPGNCATDPGSLTVTETWTMDEVTYDFSMYTKLAYSDLCVTDSITNTTTNGTLTMNMSSNSDETLLDARITFTALSIEEMDATTYAILNSSTIGGSFTMDADATSIPVLMTVTEDIVIRDDTLTDDNTYKIVMTLDIESDDSTYEDVDIDGSFYDPILGRFDLTTPAVLHTDLDNDIPTTGIMRLTGAEGRGIQVVFDAPSTFYVDLDGDGIFGETDDPYAAPFDEESLTTVIDWGN